MSILHRRRRVYERVERLHHAAAPGHPVTIPVWADLIALGDADIRALADRLGVPYTTRMGTLSAINQQR